MPDNGGRARTRGRRHRHGIRPITASSPGGVLSPGLHLKGIAKRDPNDAGVSPALGEHLSSVNTPSPTPTLSASSPSFAAPTNWPRASCTRSGSTASSQVACGTGTLLLTAVPPSIFGGSPRTLPTGADAAGGTAVTSKFYEPRDNLHANVTVPYHALAAAVVQDTNLVATLPNRLLDALTIPTSLSVIPTPAEITPISFSMAWHPRLENDPAQRWLRETIRSATSSDQTSP